MHPNIRKYLVDSLQQTAHMDAAESVYFARELEKIRERLLEVKFPENKAFSFMPMTTDVDAVDDQVTQRVGTMVGSASLGADYSNAGPTANVYDTEYSSFIRPIKNGYNYSFHDARRSAAYKKRLPERLAMAARRAVANKLDDVLLLGDGTAAYLKLYGLFKLSGTSTYSTPNGISGSATWALKSSAEVLADMCNMVTQVIVDTKEAFPPDRLVLPVSSLEQTVNRTMGDGNNNSILNEFKMRRPGVVVLTSLKLETAGSGSTKRMVAYKADSEVLEGCVPVEFEQLPPQLDGYNIVTHCHARTGGVLIHHPKAVIYGDGI